MLFQLLSDILIALHFIHDNLNCVHRNVRMPNILQKELSGDFFLIDFGLMSEMKDNVSGPKLNDVEKCPPYRNFLR